MYSYSVQLLTIAAYQALSRAAEPLIYPKRAVLSIKQNPAV
jgi:hypothetical protein